MVLQTIGGDSAVELVLCSIDHRTYHGYFFENLLTIMLVVINCMVICGYVFFRLATNDQLAMVMKIDG